MATKQLEFGTDKALLRQEGDELVAEQVRIDPFLNACNHRIVLDDLPNASGRKRLPAIRLEERCRPVLLLAFQVLRQFAPKALWEQYPAILVPFALFDAYATASKVHIGAS
jgi:hypothetical protein